ncbi:type VII toxin-antitoxin system HepT family RNase toxin [Bacillus xiapuensis]|uniref:type VII toxin-antitoxin system HepT family RNase toxin n=1 Tax=Bacillus xiapuensis TaxID=2014075 RepID=UPI000C236862|nr:DUF86 domain-containing protein [Bacillus xiapuensis]
MYFVDRQKIEETLKFMEEQLSLFAQQSNFETALEQAALERIAHTVIESMLDVGNAMIDGFIMRDPGSYEDIITILDDENVISHEMTASLKEIVSLRKMIIQQYKNIEHKEVERLFRQHFTSLQRFPEKVRAYLTDELGPVSAFIP